MKSTSISFGTYFSLLCFNYQTHTSKLFYQKPELKKFVKMSKTCFFFDYPVFNSAVIRSLYRGD